MSNEEKETIVSETEAGTDVCGCQLCPKPSIRTSSWKTKGIEEGCGVKDTSIE